MSTDCQVIVFLGPPGSGKGTQAARLSAALCIPAISTGDMLRRECNSGSPLGRAVKSILASGQLVSDDLMNQVVDSRLSQYDCQRGCILDGYPRTLSQAKYLDTLLAKLDKPRPVVFDFEISSREIVRRLSCRRVCVECGRIVSMGVNGRDSQEVCERDGSRLIQRDDDNPVSIRQRLRLHQRNAGQLIRYYRNRNYHRVAASRSADEVCDELLMRLAGTWSVPVLRRAAAVPSQPILSV
jgi:adenylate kinase